MLRANVGHDELRQRTLDAPRPGAQVEDAQLTLDARRGEPSFFVLVDPRTAWAIRVRAFANASAPVRRFSLALRLRVGGDEVADAPEGRVLRKK